MKEITYDIRRGADTYRIISESRLKGWISSGKIKSEEVLVWRSGLSGWRKAEDLEELQPFFRMHENRSSLKGFIKEHPIIMQQMPINREIKKIMLIDDEIDLCLLLSEILEKNGYIVTSVNSIRDALNFLMEETPDLVILDLNLPDGDGMRVVPEIKKKSPNTIICIASAYGSEKRKMEAKQEGISIFIDKPFSAEEILKNIKQFNRQE